MAYVDDVPADLREADIADVEPGWEERWRAFHEPVVIGPLWVGPPWEEAPGDKASVVIDPGRAFGTGAHSTTRLCLGYLLDLPRGSVLDVGCGSGVLAIAAARLGYAPVVAVDIDPAAIEATAQNAEANGVPLLTHELDAASAPLPEADVVVANIALDAVQSLVVQARALVTSGYYEDARPAVAGFAHAGRRIDGRWAADLWRPE